MHAPWFVGSDPRGDRPPAGPSHRSRPVRRQVWCLDQRRFFGPWSLRPPSQPRRSRAPGGTAKARALLLPATNCPRRARWQYASRVACADA